MATTTQSFSAKDTSSYNPVPLMHIILESLALHQAVDAVAELGVADVLAAGPKPIAELSSQLKTNESSLYRILRLLASQSIFAETPPRCLPTRRFQTACAATYRYR